MKSCIKKKSDSEKSPANVRVFRSTYYTIIVLSLHSTAEQKTRSLAHMQKTSIGVRICLETGQLLEVLEEQSTLNTITQCWWLVKNLYWTRRH